MADKKLVIKEGISYHQIPELLIAEYDLLTAAIWGVICSFINMEEHVCRASKLKIATRAGCAKRTADRRIETLINDGWIVDLTPERKNDPHVLVLGEKSYNQLAVWVDKDKETPLPKYPEGCSPDTPNQPEDQEGCNSDIPNQLEGQEGCNSDIPDRPEDQEVCSSDIPNPPEDQEVCSSDTPNSPENQEVCNSDIPNQLEDQEVCNSDIPRGAALTGEGCNSDTQIESLKDSLKDSLNTDSSSSSSSSLEKTGAPLARQTLVDDDDDDDEIPKTKAPKVSLLALLKAAGISAKNRRAILSKPEIALDDALSELAWCYNSRASKVEKPHVITPMNLLKGDFPDATCYNAAYWEQHIPDAILHKAKVTEYVRGQAQRERETGLGNSPREGRESPLPGGNGRTPIAGHNIPDKHQRAWETARGQIQLNMPKGNFNTWVRDIQLISSEDGTFTFAAQNIYARDWLESRMRSTFIRQLTGCMAQNVDVNFVVREFSHQK
ncbi:MAG: DnaA N-terminal domain-containing protein [Chloroflexota bacterium]|nr:DnaA N-terminal domain-containing protein [Chloroflexota bacterium]